MDRGAASQYTGSTASYVALSCISVLAFALLSSIWIGDASGTVALLGLISIYLASQELLVLFLVFCPASIVVDLIRLSHTQHGMSGRGWLIFLQLLEMAAKVAGGIFAWSLYKSVAGAGDAIAYAAPPGPRATPGSSYQRVEDPFATAYAAPPPRSEFAPPPGHHPPQQPLPQPQQPVPAVASPRLQQQLQQPQLAPAPPPAAPHHDLM